MPSFMKYLGRAFVGGLLASTLAALAVKPAAAQVSSETQQRNRALVQSRFDAWSNGTGSPFELLAEDARWTIEGNSVASRTYPSKEDFMQAVIRPFNARMKAPLKPAVRNIYADRDTVVVFFDARGTALDGRPYVNTYAWFLEMRAGQIVRASAFFDAIEFNDFWARVAPTD
ncbi:nuclear transport factor 2 family protein [Sphingobium phenoxybenzoativorans]|uniref:nuclear transport factor 2 family protein n=1 Tax=Sphingobium phenoxybenzoativorans TaxID=1592790 RepID=UPI000B0CDECF|nr:nuclear transport factor 2 family protein [Sphingobium phenoxybenzoativorans]